MYYQTGCLSVNIFSEILLIHFIIAADNPLLSSSPVSCCAETVSQPIYCNLSRLGNLPYIHSGYFSWLFHLLHCTLVLCRIYYISRNFNYISYATTACNLERDYSKASSSKTAMYYSVRIRDGHMPLCHKLSVWQHGCCMFPSPIYLLTLPLTSQCALLIPSLLCNLPVSAGTGL